MHFVSAYYVPNWKIATQPCKTNIPTSVFFRSPGMYMCMYVCMYIILYVRMNVCVSTCTILCSEKFCKLFMNTS